MKDNNKPQPKFTRTKPEKKDEFIPLFSRCHEHRRFCVLSNNPKIAKLKNKA